MSSTEGKDWIRQRVERLTDEGPVDVLDVGPGVGTYAKLFRDLPVRSMIGLEVWEPYVATYHLDDFYDRIIIGDVRTAELPPADVVVLGDVLEHMRRDEAVAVWHRCADSARRAVYLSVPIVHYPQDAIEGNPFEVHVDEDWDHERVLASFDGITASAVGTEVGVYERLITTPATGR